MTDATDACSVRVRGIVQGVGFRPFVYRLARDHALAGWVLNDHEGVEVHVEGAPTGLDAFVRGLREHAPPAAWISDVEITPASARGLRDFSIRPSNGASRAPTARISPDLATCERCLAELRDRADPRFGYVYVNCTDCGPRYSIIEALPYDRERTTMKRWTMDRLCAGEYHDPSSRRFHAQPVACPGCGPRYLLRTETGEERGEGVVPGAAALLRAGRVLAVKGVGGYHLACDARNPGTVRALRERKFRKEKPFALMVRGLDVGRSVADLSASAARLLGSAARPIVLCPALEVLPEVAPDNPVLGLMLPYTPLHYALFDAGAPELLVMTSANRGSEPIAYEDDDALERLAGLADAFLIGERPIARRIDDSVVRITPEGPMMVRRSRGYAPSSVCRLPPGGPILALGADLKNTITLAVDGEAVVSQHIGDLSHYSALEAFRLTVGDLLDMHHVELDRLLVVADCHPQYRSSLYARDMGAREVRYAQHHRAHVASVLAERGTWEARVVGLSLDGTGYGDDGSIWGGELFVGSLAGGFEWVGGLRAAAQAGGDAAALHPVQAAAGFLDQIAPERDFSAPPFGFPPRYGEARRLLTTGVRTFESRSTGRLFDAAAALLGFLRPVSFEGQAAMWLEHLASSCVRAVEPYRFPYSDGELDFRPLLEAVIEDRARSRDAAEIARAFHGGLVLGLRDAAATLCERHGLDTVVASGGVLQNVLLSHGLSESLAADGIALWTNQAVPPNDGGVSLGQAALATFGHFDPVAPHA